MKNQGPCLQACGVEVVGNRRLLLDWPSWSMMQWVDSKLQRTFRAMSFLCVCDECDDNTKAQLGFFFTFACHFAVELWIACSHLVWHLCVVDAVWKADEQLVEGMFCVSPTSVHPQQGNEASKDVGGMSLVLWSFQHEEALCKVVDKGVDTNVFCCSGENVYIYMNIYTLVRHGGSCPIFPSPCHIL